MKRKAGKSKEQVSEVVREGAGERRSLADAFDDLRRVRGEEAPIEAPPRIDRENCFTS